MQKPARGQMYFCAFVSFLALFSANDVAFAQSPVFGQSATIGGLNPALISSQGSTGTAASSAGIQSQSGGVQSQATADNRRVSGFGLNQDRELNEEASRQSRLQGQQVPVDTVGSLPQPAAPPIAVQQVPVLPNTLRVADQAAVTAAQAQQGGGLTADQTPFDPLGIRAGRFILRPSLESAVGYTTNSIQDVGGEASAFVSSQGALEIESDFSRHAVGLQIDAGVDRFASGEDSLDLDINVSGNVRYDVSDDTAVSALASLNIGEDDLIGVADDPLEGTLVGTLQLDHRVGSLDTRTQLRGSRNINGSFVDATGATISQDDQNSFLLGANFRGTLRRGGTFSPFLEGDISREKFDEGPGGIGPAPNVVTVQGVVGTEIDRGDKLNGEVSIGFGQNFVDTPGIGDFGGIVAEGNLVWSPQRLTTITFNGITTFDAFPSVATPGDTTYDFTVLGTRQVKENLELSVGGGVLLQVDGGGAGTDITYSANAGLAYSLNRNVALTLDYNFAREFTETGLGDFTSNSIALGLRFER